MIYWPNTLNAQANQGVVPSLKNSRILYQSLASSATATAETDGYPAANVLKPDTYSWWIPGEAATLTLTLPSQSINCIGIAAHNLGSAGVTATISVGGVNVLDDDPSPSDDMPIMAVFPAVTADTVTIAVDGACRIGVVYVGRTLDMIQPAYNEHTPVSFAARTSYLSGESVSGQWLGRTVERVNRPFTAGWSHLPENWTYTHVVPFLRSIRTSPFFMAQRPSGYPRDVAYVMGPNEDVIPARMGVRDYMEFSIECTGHAEVSA